MQAATARRRPSRRSRRRHREGSAHDSGQGLRGAEGGGAGAGPVGPGHGARRLRRAGPSRCSGTTAPRRARAGGEARGSTLTDLTRRRRWTGMAALIVSPGHPASLSRRRTRVIARALEAGVPVDNDIGLFFRSLRHRRTGTSSTRAPRVVAVTGSNGKSTTTALIHHILEAAGRPTQMAGNIGRGVLDIDPPGTARWWCWSCPPTRPSLPAR